MRLNKQTLALAAAMLAFACQNEEDQTPPVAASPNVAVNQWILNVMSEVYLWLDDMGTPIADDSDPEEYFDALLNTPTDRFSVIYPDYQELINSLSGISLEAGYEFILYRQSSENNNVIAEISYIKKNSPASNVDLKRGDFIYEINGTQITLNNYLELLDAIEGTHSLSYARYNEAEEQYYAMPEVTLTAVQLAENPNFLDTVYTIDNEKIGYLVYHFFAPGTSDNATAYDDEMDEIFANFKAEGIDHLILDFRYNGGGYVSSAVNLASLIAPGVGTSSVFSKTKYNSFLMENVPSLSDVKTAFEAKTQNLGNTLANNRVYVLTSSRTASASELIVNGLKPYMDVFLIGNVTYGKNVGSIAFEDEENEDNAYGILPIVSQSFNSLDQSEYSEGFTPNISVLESQEPLLPFGDTNELLLRTAISQITGVASGGRFKQLDRQDVGSSLDHKPRTGVQIEKPIQN